MSKTESSESATLDLQKAKSMARRVIEHHFGAKPKRIEHQASGLTNLVFLVHHAEGDFIVRINSAAGKINSYIKEQWAVGKAREAGVPTAEILEVGNEVIPYPYMIARRVKGIEATQHPERFSILRELGRYATLINAISTDGFGHVFDWSGNQLSRNATWKEYLETELQLEARLQFLKKHRLLSPAKLKSVQSILVKEMRKPHKPALNHGDIRLKNAIVNNDGTILAILDWEDCMSNLAPHWELSLALHDLTIDEKQEFLRGYTLSEKSLLAISPVIKALNIINYVPHIEPMLELNDRSILQEYRIRLSGALDLYSF